MAILCPRIGVVKAIFVFFLLLASSGESLAAAISAIEVRGNRRIESGTILTYLPLRVGDDYNNAAGDRALKALFSTGLFSDIKIRQKGTRLFIELSENPIVNEVRFEGNDALDEEALAPLINIAPRSVYSRALVLTAAQTIIQQYRRQGYYRVRVEPKIIELKFHRVNIVFEVNEGRKSFVQEIYFQGNKAFGDSDLRGAIASTEYNILKFLSVTDTYDPDRLEFDKQLLRSFYTRRGFADFSVRAVLAERNPSSDGFYITFIIDEGKRYKFGENIFRIKIPGLSKKNFAQLIEYDVGDTFDGFKIGKSRDAINAEAQTLGYAFINVIPDLEKNQEKQIVQVVWHIAEAPRTYVEKINIVGNSHTESEVIRREFRLQEGDAFNRTLLAQTDRFLKGLGFFENVVIEPRQGSAPDKVILDTIIAEKPTGSISLGLGFSTADGFLGNFSIQETNFQGKGQTLSAGFSYAQRRQSVNFGFSEPYLLGYRLNFGSNFFFNTSDLVSTQGYELDRLGLNLSLTLPLREDAYLSFSYRIANDFVHNSSGGVREGSTLESSLGYRISYDRRDDIQNPTDGWFVSFGQDFAGVGGQAKYMRSSLDFRFYHTLADAVSSQYIFASRLTAGHLLLLDGYEARTLHNFFLGAGTLRGFDRSGAGPRRTGSDRAVGSRAYGIWSNELRISAQILKQVGLTPVLFLDTAIIGDSGSDTRAYYNARNDTIRDNFGLRISAGFSILWESPLGPLRFDFADVLLKESYDQEKNFNFQIGVTF